MMKRILDLSKDELVGIISHNLDGGGCDIHANYCSCAMCGEPDAKYYYQCDKCAALDADDEESYFYKGKAA